MQYLTKTTVQVWANVWPVRFGKRDKIRQGQIVESKSGRKGYAFLDAPVRGYVSMAALEKIIDPPLPPNPQPSGAGIYWTIRGDAKPAGYLPEGTNYGSFDIGWLLDVKPQKVINKPEGFKLAWDHVELIKRLNDYDVEKLGWLVDQNGNRKVLSLDENGQYRCPVPCFCGSNPVMILEMDERFVRIATVGINDPLPERLPEYLCHTWYGFTKGGEYFTPRGGVRYPLFSRNSTAWIQKSGIQMNMSSLPAGYSTLGTQ